MPVEQEIDVSKIHPNPRNRNIHTPDDVTRLANNIKAYGLTNPILVHPIGRDQFQIIVGEGRWKAFKELKRRTVPSRVMDAGTKEVEIDGMRLSENRVRTFDLIAECQELANLHRQGKSIPILTREFGGSQTHLNEKVSVGYFPDKLLNGIRATAPWSLQSLAALLPLRRGGLTISERAAHGARREHISLDDIYDYSEVESVVERVINGELRIGPEFFVFVAERRAVLIETAQQQQIQAKLDEKFAAAQQALEAKFRQDEEQLKARLGEEYEIKLGGVQKQLAQAVMEAQKAREERARLEANHMAELRKVREEIATAHRKELSVKEQSFSSQLDRLQKELQQARQAQAKAVQDAETKLRREYDRKVAAAEAAAGKTKEEIEQSQQTIAALRAELAEKIAEREAEIRAQYEERVNEKLVQMQGIVAERDRWKQEAASLGKQLERQEDRATELEKSYQERITEKEGDIVSRDARIAELLQMRTRIEAELGRKSKEEAQQEAQRSMAEYQVTLQKEFEEKLVALEQSYARREQELRLKTNKTLDDAINRFMQLSNEIDASMRLLVFDYLEHFSRVQLTDFSVRLEWVDRKVSEARDAVARLQGQIIDI